MHRFHKWRDVLQSTSDQRALAAVMHDYVKALPHDMVEVLPADCQLVLVGDLDIQAAAVTLLRSELGYAGAPEIRDLLHEVAHTFAAASVRLTSLHGRSEPTPRPVE